MLALLAALGFALVGTGWAGEQPPADKPALPAATLESLIDATLASNPEVRFYEAELAEAEARRRGATRWADPQLSGQIGHQRLGGVGDGVAWSVSLVQPFEWPGRIGLRKAIANCDLELARLGLVRFRVALAARTRSLACRLQVAQQEAEAARELASRLESLREVLLAREPAGITPLLEARIIEAAHLIASKRANDTEIAAVTARVQLNRWRGAPGDAELPMPSQALQFRPLDSLPKLLALARSNNFELRLRELELSQQGLRVDLARNERLPAIAIGPAASETTADEQRIVGLAVSLPLPIWNRNRAAIAAAAAREDQARAAFAVALQNLEKDVTEAALAYGLRREESARRGPNAADQFRDAALLADRHYRLGAVPVATYVELQRQYVDALEALLATRLELIEDAARLETLTGVPPLVTWESASPAEARP